MTIRSVPCHHLCLPALVLCSLSVGCFHTRVYSAGLPDPDTPIEVRRAAYFWGLKAPQSLFVDKSCPRGIAQVETRHTAGDLGWTVLTLGVYSPLTLRVTCSR